VINLFSSVDIEWSGVKARRTCPSTIEKKKFNQFVHKKIFFFHPTKDFKILFEILKNYPISGKGNLQCWAVV
jgi:hypothetical protein